MTLPVQPVSNNNNNNNTNNNNNGKAPFLRQASPVARRTNCRSAVWAETPIINKRERRRAICSWTAGYGTLLDESEDFGLPLAERGKRDKVARTDARRTLTTSSTAPSISPPQAPPGGAAPSARRLSRSRLTEPLLTAMPGIRSLWGSRQRRGGGGQAAAPLVGLKASPAPTIQPTGSLANLRKCETTTGYLRSSSSTSSIEPLQPVNRLRVSPHASNSRMCSRCSSLLTLASTSRYSLNSTTGGFVPVAPEEPPLLCKLCLLEVPMKDAVKIEQCNCAFCNECMAAYVKFEITEGAYEISCPDAQCPSQGVLSCDEVRQLSSPDLMEKHVRYRLNREVELDKTRTWCPRAGCETVCKLCRPRQPCAPQSVFCPTCSSDFCSNCKSKWHEGLSCDEFARSRDERRADVGGIPFDSELIKCCPMCNVPIEKDEGCAQMMCKRCKHVFCWYCLASLDDDFLLRHYDKGPCKNKLGHSRASVIWHRTQVIGIFAGFGILLLMASPLLLLAAPCIVCCKCRFCNTGTNAKLSNEDDDDEEVEEVVGTRNKTATTES